MLGYSNARLRIVYARLNDPNIDNTTNADGIRGKTKTDAKKCLEMTAAFEAEAEPFVPGQGTDYGKSVWAGWTAGLPYGVGVTVQTPIIQGSRPMCAALKVAAYEAAGDAATVASLKAKIQRYILAQIAQEDFSDRTRWNFGVSGNSRVPYEAGVREGSLVHRVLMAYSAVKDTMSAPNQALVETWLTGYVDWCIGRFIDGPVDSVFPNRENPALSFAQAHVLKGYDASPTWTFYPIYPDGSPWLNPPDNTCQGRQGWIKTLYGGNFNNPAIDSSGILYPELNVTCFHWANRWQDKWTVVGAIGRFLNNADAIFKAELFLKEMMAYAVYPNGIPGEWERNNDYGDSSQGLNYFDVGLHGYAWLAYLEKMYAGTTTMWDFFIRDGVHNNVGNKTAFLPIDLRVDLMTQRRRMYVESVKDTNRICDIKIPGKTYYNYDSGTDTCTLETVVTGAQNMFDISFLPFACDYLKPKTDLQSKKRYTYYRNVYMRRDGASKPYNLYPTGGASGTNVDVIGTPQTTLPPVWLGFGDMEGLLP